MMNGPYRDDDDYGDEVEDVGTMIPTAAAITDNNNNNMATTTLEQRARAKELKEQHDQELQFYQRFGKFLVVLLIFWFAMLYFGEHHDTVFLIGGITVFLLWFGWIMTCLCCHLCTLWKGETPISMIMDGEDIIAADLDQMEHDDAHDALQGPFEETPDKIRQCCDNQLLTLTTPGMVGPSNGTYKAVYTAVYFNHSVRTEGQLELKFYNTSSKGWSIEGESLFGKDKHNLEGFVNAKGEMYWKTDKDTIYRGLLDFQSSCLFDGDFQPSTGPPGRIVRLELTKASFYSSNTSSSTTSPMKSPLGGSTNNNSGVEMITFSSNNDDDDDDDDDDPENAKLV